jgi:hypothetical protein
MRNSVKIIIKVWVIAIVMNSFESIAFVHWVSGMGRLAGMILINGSSLNRPSIYLI